MAVEEMRLYPRLSSLNSSKILRFLMKEEKEGMERVSSTIGQAEKSARGMPWHQEPTKDVTSCDKPREGANIL